MRRLRPDRSTPSSAFPLRATHSAGSRRCGPRHTWSSIGLHAHLGSQLFDLSVFGPTADVLGRVRARRSARETSSVVDLGGGLGVAYASGHAPAIDRGFAAAQADALERRSGHADCRLPRCSASRDGRWSAARGSPLYRVGGIKPIPGVRTYASVDGGMSDLLRPMLYGAVYEPLLANRAGGARRPHLPHCRQALRERRHPRRRGAPAGTVGRRRALPAGHGSVRRVDGVQLQRPAAARSGVCGRRRGTPGHAAGDLRRYPRT